MKRLKYLLISFIYLLLPVTVLAAGNISASPSSLTIEVGSSKTFTISAVNSIGDVTISSSNTAVATVSSGEWGTGMVEEGQTKSGTITVNGVSEGSATITLTLDAATFDGDDLAGQTRTISVNVVPKSVPNNNDNNGNNATPTPEPTPAPSTTPSTPATNPNNNTNNNTTPTTPAKETKSNNNNVISVVVAGYVLSKIDANNYSVSVPNYVTEVDIKVTLEDSKAKVTGDGLQTINVGENKKEIIVTAESGLQNKIYVIITRKESYSLNDLNYLLKNFADSSKIDINIEKDTTITAQNLESIKKAGKTVSFNCLDETNKLLYSWIIDGTKIDNPEDLLTTITFESKNKDDILKQANSKDGVFVNFQQTKNIPEGTVIKVYVGSKYKDGDKLSAYTYQNKKLELVDKDLEVKNGYVEFNKRTDAEDYFLSLVNETETDAINVATTGKKTNYTWIIIAGILVIAAATTTVIILKKKKSKSTPTIDLINKAEESEPINIETLNNNPSNSQSNNWNDYYN